MYSEDPNDYPERRKLSQSYVIQLQSTRALAIKLQALLDAMEQFSRTVNDGIEDLSVVLQNKTPEALNDLQEIVISFRLFVYDNGRSLSERIVSHSYNHMNPPSSRILGMYRDLIKHWNGVAEIFSDKIIQIEPPANEALSGIYGGANSEQERNAIDIFLKTYQEEAQKLNVKIIDFRTQVTVAGGTGYFGFR